MKNAFFVVIVALLSCVYVYGQEDSVKQRVYAGVLVNGYSDGGGRFQNDANIRVGAKTDFFFIPHLSFVGRTAYSTTNPQVAHFFFVGTVDVFDVSAGFMPRPMSLLKPDPVSAAAQLELASNKTIPGPTTGLLATVRLDPSSRDSSNRLMFGRYYLSDGSAEYDAGVTVFIRGAIPMKFGLAVLWGDNQRRMFNVLMQGFNFSGLIFCDVSPQNPHRPVTVHVEYDLSSWKIYADGVFEPGNIWTSWEFGGKKEYKVKGVSTTLGFGYGKDRTLRSFVLLYI
jgi:hypothetical protein